MKTSSSSTAATLVPISWFHSNAVPSTQKSTTRDTATTIGRKQKNKQTVIYKGKELFLGKYLGEPNWLKSMVNRYENEYDCESHIKLSGKQLATLKADKIVKPRVRNVNLYTSDFVKFLHRNK